MCITDESEKYRKWEKLDREDSFYYNAYPYADIYMGVEVRDKGEGRGRGGGRRGIGEKG